MSKYIDFEAKGPTEDEESSSSESTNQSDKDFIDDRSEITTSSNGTFFDRYSLLFTKIHRFKQSKRRKEGVD